MATTDVSAYTFFSAYDFQDFHLDAGVEEKIRQRKKTKKVAFLSGCKRVYYPEKPGHSKFAQVFSPFGDPQIPRAKLYMPPDTDRLDKPISKKGYGIGGLSAPRFVTGDLKEKRPGPAHYQKVEEKKLGRQHQFPPKVWMNFCLIRKDGGNKQLRNEVVCRKLTGMWDKCQQIRVAFGSSLRQPRFGKTPKWNCVGPGHYVVKEYNPPKISVNTGFLRGPVSFNATTKLHCSYGPKDCCVECGRTLMGSLDYYRSKRRISLVPVKKPTKDKLHDDQPSFFRRSEEATPVSTKISEKEGKRTRVLLCRQCYCKAMRGESRYWKEKKDVKAIFEKTRHCTYIHEHNGFPQYTEKASCDWTRNLTKKEATLSLHWPDKCEKRMVEKK